MSEQFGLKPETIAKIQEVLSHYPEVQKAIIYGSRAKGNFKKGSDIDLTLIGDNNLNTKILRKIMEEIDDLLLPYIVDLSLYRDITDPAVQDHIIRIGKTFYERNNLM